MRPIVALEWVAELEMFRPLPHEANASARAEAIAAATRRPAVAAELARGVSADMLMRSHTFGPNKQEQQGADVS